MDLEALIIRYTGETSANSITPGINKLTFSSRIYEYQIIILITYNVMDTLLF